MGYDHWKSTEPDDGREPPVDPREPDYSRPGIFATHNCWKCQHGRLTCVTLDPRGCEYPRARNE